MVVAVWVFVLVGRIYREPLASGDAPRWLQRAIPQRRLAVAQAVLDKHGPAVAVLGRIGALPPTVLAAAAGASHASARRYLVADAVGALISFALMVAAGYAVGRAWQEGGRG
jgi:membrane protein DedA with SNARE-associated domain